MHLPRLFKRRPHKKSQEGRLAALLDHHGITSVIDVGANAGQTYDRLRGLGFRGKVVSIEPISRLQQQLSERAKTERNWTVLPPMALSNREGTTELLVSEADDLSSLRAPVPDLNAALPRAAEVARETVKLQTLDALWPTFNVEAGSTLLKLDAQGSEAEILEGASTVLPTLCAILVELSLVPLYEGEADYLTICSTLHKAGFVPVLFIPGYFSRNIKRQLQMDGFFVRRP